MNITRSMRHLAGLAGLSEYKERWFQEPSRPAAKETPPAER